MCPVFQYVGEHVTHTDRIFLRGFSFSRALGVPPSCWPATDPSPVPQDPGRALPPGAGAKGEDCGFFPPSLGAAL